MSAELTAHEDSPTERTALLPKNAPKRTPLPKFQIGILLLLQLAEPVCALSIYPYINQLVWELDITGGDPQKVGYYAGLIESLFFATESLTILHWARLSDRIGRKPVLLFGMLGASLSMICFGLSRTFFSLVVSRCVMGALNGNTSVMKSMMGEITDSTNIAQGFGLMPVVWSVGATLGPFMGGQLARPQQRFPEVFTSPFWRKYPYFLPCFIAASFTMVLFILVLLFLKETVKRTPTHDPKQTTESNSPIGDNEKPLPLRALFIPRVLNPISNYAALAFIDMIRAAIQPLFYSTAIKFGGLGMNPATIGLCLGLEAFVVGGIQMFAFPVIIRRVGYKRVFTISMGAFVPLFAMYPLINWVAAWCGGVNGLVWGLLGVQILLVMVMDMAFGCIFIYIIGCAPNKRSLGATNGLAQTTASVMRMFAPVLGTSMFAFSKEKNLLGGNAVYIVLGGLSLASLGLVRRLPEDASYDSVEEVGSNQDPGVTGHLLTPQEVYGLSVLDVLLEFSLMAAVPREDLDGAGSEPPPTEETALLPKQTRQKTPLPKTQARILAIHIHIGILLLLQLSEPICSQSIYPYINQLIAELNITGGDSKKVGYYVGLIQSLYFATETVTVLQWSRLSDRIGRKPVLLIGMFGTMASMLAFGLSKTLVGLILSRSIAGALNGNVGVMKSMMGEITDSTNVAAGFSLIPVVWAAGSTIGPFVGGQLARPHERFPSVFDTPFWRTYPYFLPCFATAMFSLISFVIVLFFLKETVKKGTNTRRPTLSTSETGTSTPSLESSQDVLPLRALFIPRVLHPVFNYTALAWLDIMCLVIQPLFYSTPIAYGGLGMTPATIGLYLGAQGVLNGFFQGFFFARIIERLGAKRLFTLGMSAFIPIFLMFPVINAVAMRDGYVSWSVWALVLLQMSCVMVMDMAFGCIFIFIRASSPTRRSLGAVNGIAQTTASIARTIGPALAASMFAFSKDHNVLGGNAVYWILAGIALSSLLLARRLPDDTHYDDED